MAFWTHAHRLALSNWLATGSTCCWVMSEFPQVIKNHRLQRSEDTDVTFLIFLVLMDALTIVNGFFNDLLMSEFVFFSIMATMDAILLAQTVHLNLKNGLSWNGGKGDLLPLLSASLLSLCTADNFAWVAPLGFVVSRLCQIRHSVKTKSTETVSKLFFVLAIMGNVLFTAQVLVVSVDREYLRHQAPYLLGAAGLIPFDVFIFFLSFYYSRKGGRDAFPALDAE